MFKGVTGQNFYSMMTQDTLVYVLYHLITLFILMDFPKHIDMLSMESPFCVIRGHMSTFLQYDVIIPLKIVIFPNSSDPVEMRILTQHFI